MRTRSQNLAAKRKIQDDLTVCEQANDEQTLAAHTTTASKGRKRTKLLAAENHAEVVTVEKRLHGYRPKPTPAMRVRIQRALDQRLYLLAVSSTSAEPVCREYTVFGQTGNVYTVTIAHLPSCTCKLRKFLCKSKLKIAFFG